MNYTERKALLSLVRYPFYLTNFGLLNFHSPVVWLMIKIESPWTSKCLTFMSKGALRCMLHILPCCWYGGTQFHGVGNVHLRRNQDHSDSIAGDIYCSIKIDTPNRVLFFYLNLKYIHLGKDQLWADNHQSDLLSSQLLLALSQISIWHKLYQISNSRCHRSRLPDNTWFSNKYFS